MGIFFPCLDLDVFLYCLDENFKNNKGKFWPTVTEGNLFLYLAEKHNISACLDAGDMLQTIKMPGGHIPWNCDGDVVVIQKDSSDATYTRDTISNYMTEYNFQYREGYGDGDTYDPAKTYDTGDKLLCYGTKNTHLKLDTYFTKLHITDPTVISHFCRNGFEMSGRSSKVFLQGFEISTAHNPGKAARFEYGTEYLKHVSQRDTSIEDYAKEKIGFTERCARSPLHSCLRDVPIDGNSEEINIVSDTYNLNAPKMKPLLNLYL